MYVNEYLMPTKAEVLSLLLSDLPDLAKLLIVKNSNLIHWFTRAVTHGGISFKLNLRRKIDEDQRNLLLKENGQTQ